MREDTGQGWQTMEHMGMQQGGAILRTLRAQIYFLVAGDSFGL